MKYKYRENQHLDHAMRKLAAIQLLLSRLGGLKLTTLNQDQKMHG
jgi:hypothetical protein